MTRQAKIILLTLVAALLVWFTWDAFNQPGVNDLQGGFKEVATYRNENNTGPVIRVYAVTVADPDKAEMEAYGNYMPHTKYGNTKVFFFSKDKLFPKAVFPGEENFPAEFQQKVIGRYEKDAMGQVSFKKF
ncbi:hypothetical protein [Adhaeribacter terreus]|uniref:Uncharacterized protein n=1 Tax=Adhaeribacter terreus TaxID=529703 RepID=A0ABW0EIJ4_9BACT